MAFTRGMHEKADHKVYCSQESTIGYKVGLKNRGGKCAMLFVDKKIFLGDIFYFMVNYADFKNMKNLCQKYINRERCGYVWA